MSQDAPGQRGPSSARASPNSAHSPQARNYSAILFSSLVFYCLFASFQHQQAAGCSSASGQSSWLPRLTVGAHAAQVGLHAHQPASQRNHAPLHQDQELIAQLNLTNFNSELIQLKHQFAHIKLIEFYVAYCGFCTKFKQTLIKLAREIQPWKNVIRPAAIDISLPLNIPIANARTVDEVPKLRLHPPPYKSLAERLDKQLATLRKNLSLDHTLMQTSNTSFSLADAQTELQKSMLDEYNLSNLMIEPLENTKQYLDNVPLLKANLLNYIERFVQHRIRVQQQPLPSTWPNLSPVTETSLAELRRNHPRKELFLIIEGHPHSESSQAETDQSSTGPVSLGLSIMLELSSAAPWRAVRYVRASENKPLIEDVISKLNVTPPAWAQVTPPTSTTTDLAPSALSSATTITATSESTTTTIADNTTTATPQSVTGKTSSATTLALLQPPTITGADILPPQAPAHNQRHQYQRHFMAGLHNNHHQQNLHSEHLELLNNFLMNKTKNSNNILLVHMGDLHLNQQHPQHHHQYQHSSDDRSYSSAQDNLPHQEAALIQPFISVISGSDLAVMDHPEASLEFTQPETSINNNGGRAKRVAVIDHLANSADEKVQVQPTHHDEKNVVATSSSASSASSSSSVEKERKRRSMTMSSVRPSMPDDQISRERLVEMVSSYIRQVYSETDEDREFVSAINQLEEPCQVTQGFNFIVIACFGCLSLIVVLRCANSYIERQRRHKATLLNANGAHYTLQFELK